MYKTKIKTLLNYKADKRFWEFWNYMLAFTIGAAFTVILYDIFARLGYYEIVILK